MLVLPAPRLAVLALLAGARLAAGASVAAAGGAGGADRALAASGREGVVDALDLGDLFFFGSCRFGVFKSVFLFFCLQRQAAGEARASVRWAVDPFRW